VEWPTGDSGIPAAIWSEIASISHVAVVAPSVNDAMLQQLAQHRGLIALHCRGGEWSASASSTAELKKCPLLKSLNFESTPVTAETINKLTELGNLRELSINDTVSSNELIAAITQLKELESLSLLNAEVTDEHVTQIAKLTKLRMLVLHQLPAVGPDKPKLTDQGLQALKNLKALKHLNLLGHSFSKEAASDFEKSLPNCQFLKSVTTNSLKNDTKF
jgi:Leucine-rich repeat (LRR) protein